MKKLVSRHGGCGCAARIQEVAWAAAELRELQRFWVEHGNLMAAELGAEVEGAEPGAVVMVWVDVTFHWEDASGNTHESSRLHKLVIDTDEQPSQVSVAGTTAVGGVPACSEEHPCRITNVTIKELRCSE
jgi:hypothetical protein